MQSLKWFIAGAIGGAIGAAIWVAVGHFTSYEVGWIAWGIGALVGIAVRKAAGEIDGPAPGVVAGATAIIAVLIAKFLVAGFLVSNALSEYSALSVTTDDMVAFCANEIVAEREAAGKEITWPEQNDDVETPLKDQYPKEIWTEAEKRWESLSPKEKEENTATYKADFARSLEQAKSDVRAEVFKGSFSPWDLLWFGLAAFTAFKIGSGLANDA